MSQPPLNVLVVGRDRNMFVEAYNDATDLDDDGVYDVEFKPSIDYYGYFNSHVCYEYSTTNGRFEAAQFTADKKCGGNYWSGNLLNYVAMSRADVLRKSLYGGAREGSSAVLVRSRVPRDSHAWGKQLTANLSGQGSLLDYVPADFMVGTLSYCNDAANSNLCATITGTTNTIKSRLDLGHTLVFANADDGSTPVIKVASAGNGVDITQWVSSEGNANLNNTRFSDMVGMIAKVVSCTSYDLQAALVLGRNANCRLYGSTYKPTGLLHKYSVDNNMEFALFTSIYSSPRSGAALRVGMRRFASEIDANGDFAAGGIVKTLDALMIYKPNSGGYNSGGDGNWGNPLAEMYYEVLRYYAGKSGPSYFTAGSRSTIDKTNIGINFLEDWSNYKPYAGKNWCSKPFITVVSDAVSSFDSQLPGSAFESMASETGMTELDVGTLAATLWNREFAGVMKTIMIGQVSGNNNSVGLPTGKSARSFNVRGISPEEPTRQGGFYGAMAAYYARSTPLVEVNVPAGKSKPVIRTFAIALSNSQPKVELKFPQQTVTFIPYARSGSNTMSIVDYYLFKSDTSCTWPDCYRFRVNFENSEDGSDWDVDHIVDYRISKDTSSTVRVKVDTFYAANGAQTYAGFIISGVSPLSDATDGNKTGPYLVIREKENDPAAQTWNGYKGTSIECIASNQPYYSLLYGLHNSPRRKNCLILPENFERIFTVNNGDATVERLQSPLWYMAKYGGYTDAKTGSDANGLVETNQWDADGDGVPDAYASATNPLKLEQQLDRIFNTIQQQAPFLVPAVGSSSKLETDTVEYTAGYDSADWSGNLIAKKYDSTQKKFATTLWSAAELLPASSSRQIIAGVSNSAVKAIPFTSASLALPAYNLLPSLRESVESNSVAINRVDYLRGNAANEGITTGKFRVRSRTKLGDILHSRGVYVGAPVAGFRSDNSYTSFYNSYKSRIPILYVGANDGMLHGFDAASGVERFAFIPKVFLSSTVGQSPLIDLTEQNYSHRYFVDGQLHSSAAWADSSWKTLLAGGLRGGGRSLFLLNVTAPANLLESKANELVQWEFTSFDDSDLGLTFAQPQILQLNDGNWYVVSPNGYNSSNGRAAMFFLPVNARTSWTSSGYKKMVVEQATAANGLSDFSYYDLNKDGKVDLIYAGDLKGNIWRFNVSSSDTSKWTASSIFVAAGPDGKAQPVVLAPQITQHPTLSLSRSATVPNLVLTFAAGKFLEACDKDAAGCSGESSTRSVYSIWDFGGIVCKRDELAEVGVQHFPDTMPKTRHVFDYGTLRYPTAGVRNANCLSNGFRTLASADGSGAYSLSGYKLGFYLDLKLPLENVVNLEVFGKNRVIFETDYRKSQADVCESEFVTYPYDNFSLTGKQLIGVINPPESTEVEELISRLIALGYDEKKARLLATGIGGPGSLPLAGSYGLIRRNTFKKGSQCYLSYNGSVIGPVACGSRIVKRVSWREVVSD
ncbi:MAG: pilus assembly protein [Vogesella sp.]|uniref:pilus assembly protein n=1 Tax=Vogesella sp. TaxID=1904252 RepID=UPI00391A8322